MRLDKQTRLQADLARKWAGLLLKDLADPVEKAFLSLDRKHWALPMRLLH
jgi:hypothetical protein